MPTWFAVLLVADMVVAVLAAGLLVATPETAGAARPHGLALAAGSILAGSAAVAGARRLWRHDAETAALILAMLPMIAGVPYVFAVLGLPF